MKKIVIALTFLFSKYAGAVEVEDIKSTLENQGWKKSTEHGIKLYSDNASLKVYKKSVQTDGFGLKEIRAITDKKGDRIWIGSKCKRVFLSSSKIRGIDYSTYQGRVSVIGNDWNLDQFADENVATQFLQKIETAYQKNPFVWTTTCVAPEHFAALQEKGKSKVVDIVTADGATVLKIKGKKGAVAEIPIGFDHSDDSCTTKDEVEKARSSKKAYPAGTYSWMRGQPSEPFKFDFDENLNTQISVILSIE